jgi:hypothetical protein
MKRLAIIAAIVTGAVLWGRSKNGQPRQAY